MLLALPEHSSHRQRNSPPAFPVKNQDVVS
jgi:hypothetical protein